MSKKRLLIIGGLVFLFITAFLLANQGISNAQQGVTRIVRIWVPMGAPDRIILEPKITRVAKNTVVVWWNKGGGEAKILFTEGQHCEVATSSPTGFKLESQNCYVTSYIPPGSMSSLKFDKEGTYEFEITIKNKGTDKGKIIVTEMD